MNKFRYSPTTQLLYRTSNYLLLNRIDSINTNNKVDNNNVVNKVDNNFAANYKLLILLKPYEVVKPL